MENNMKISYRELDALVIALTVILIVALCAAMAYVSQAKAADIPTVKVNGVIVVNSNMAVKQIVLDDGTKCAVLTSLTQSNGSISCGWH